MTHMGKLIEFNTSCASVFTQRAAIEAMRRTGGDAAGGRAPEDLPRHAGAAAAGAAAVELAPAKGGMYAFFKLDGYDDSLALAKRLVAEAGIGLAPGNAFAPEAQGWLRWCFASRTFPGCGRAWTGSRPGSRADRIPLPGPSAIIPRFCIRRAHVGPQSRSPSQVNNLQGRT